MGTRLKTVAQWLTVAAACGWFVFASYVLACIFPGAYVWTEWMISYAGGFVRRALMGEIAWRLDGVVPAWLFLSVVIGACYCFVATWLIVSTFRRPAPGFLLLLFSPAGLLFPVLDFSAFGRKDVFVVACYLLVIEVGRRAPAAAVRACLAIYLVACFVVEFTIFYFPLAFVSAARLRADGRAVPRRTWLVGLSFFLGVTALFALTPPLTAEGAQAILDAWRVRYPDRQFAPQAIDFLTGPFLDHIEFARQNVLSATTLGGYLAGLSLALLPLSTLDWSVRSRTAVARLPECAAVLATFVPFAIMADWGRTIHMVAMHLFAAALTLWPRSPTEEGSSALHGRPRSVDALLFALLPAYALTWSLRHLVISGQCPLTPGPIFAVFG
jgi:hypothetical protein